MRILTALFIDAISLLDLRKKVNVDFDWILI